MKTRVVGDLSGLDKHGSGARLVTWWGTIGFMSLEGMGFVLGAGSFLYLGWHTPTWAAGAPPQEVIWPTVFTAILVLSLIPNYAIMKRAQAQDNGTVRALLVLMSVIGVLAVGVRGYEFTQLNIGWYTNAYGSLLWVLLGLHTTHLLTDLADTIVLTALFFTRHCPTRRFSDADENAMYWNFVVIAWLPFYVLLYWVPRLGGG
ncbi:MAG TPA: cytochrome c oxidase subunit 3 [Devosiaceae bacterium]|jgi:heme/copper-type cytochrome/quinol oxidase subunit 3|nr:cytochrome c oxidase subunit 3 [Devosiaceae bacterium]